MTNYIHDNLASGIFTTKPPSKRKRRGSRDVPERDKNAEYQTSERPVSYAEKDAAHWRIEAIYGKQEELEQTHRGRRDGADIDYHI